MPLRFVTQSLPPLPHTCIPFGECRAKTCADGTPGTSVFDHCRYAGYVAEALLDLLPPAVRAQLPTETPFLVALHDIGKVSPGFVGKYFMPLLETAAPDWATIYRTGRTETNHATIGARALQRLFGLPADHPVVLAVSAHHGFKPDSLLTTRDGNWQNERAALVRALAAEFSASPESALAAATDAELLAGLTCVSDWIASDDEFFPPADPPLSPSAARARAAEAVSACGFARPSFRRGLSFRDIFGFDPRPAQAAFLEEVAAPGVYVLEAPMGAGKTESALFAAYRLVASGVHSGIYFALPTRLTSDRIHERVESFLRAVSDTPAPVKLAHGQAWLKEFAPGAEGSDATASRRPPPWFNPSKRGLLFPYAVGTIDQALLAVLNVKHSFVRAFALAGKVVVLDEVHSYDAYTGALLDELVARLRRLGCTVIILSATLTATRRAALLGTSLPASDAYPLLTGLPAADAVPVVRPLPPPPSRAVRLRWLDATADAPLSLAIEKARAGCNVLCIANTVATAQDWFRALQSGLREGDAFPVGLLHSRFTGADREALESEWMGRLGKSPADRPRGSILVATQIVEQSVDIDADWMLSELAPVDMLFQRLGRLWRHNRPSRPVPAPELAVVCAQMPPADLSALPPAPAAMLPFFGLGVLVYAPYVLLRTFETLRPLSALRIPADIRPLLETVYSDAVPDTPLHRALFADLVQNRDRLRDAARIAQSDAIPASVDSALTRYDTRPTISLLLLRALSPSASPSDALATLADGESVAVSSSLRDLSVTRALYRNLVRIPPNDALLAAAALTPNPDHALLRQHFFPSDMPLVCLLDPQSGTLRLHATGRDAGYGYTSRLGAFRNTPNSAMVSANTSPP